MDIKFYQGRVSCIGSEGQAWVILIRTALETTGTLEEKVHSHWWKNHWWAHNKSEPLRKGHIVSWWLVNEMTWPIDTPLPSGTRDWMLLTSVNGAWNTVSLLGRSLIKNSKLDRSRGCASLKVEFRMTSDEFEFKCETGCGITKIHIFK